MAVTAADFRPAAPGRGPRAIRRPRGLDEAGAARRRSARRAPVAPGAPR